MKDCCGKNIIPISKQLSVHTNRHPNINGTRWGWIEGCGGNICWSDDSQFNHKKADEFVRNYNEIN